MSFENEALSEQSKECKRYTQLLSDELGTDIDINNNHDIRRIFNDKLGYDIDTFSCEWLEAHQYDNQAMYYLSWAKYHRANLSRYSINKLTNTLGGDGRIHPIWYRCYNTTGRLTCKSPALQGLPSLYRKYYIPEDGNVFVTADYKTVDIRCLARITNDKKLITNLGAGHDIHAETASIIYGVPVNEISKEQRQIGKRTNFAITYGSTEIGLSKMLSIETGSTVSPKEAKSYIDSFLKLYPKVYHYRWQLLNRKIKPTSVSGKIFNVEGTKALNYPIQASTAEGLMKTLGVILDTKDDDMKLVMTIHDSITLEVPESKQMVAQDFLKYTAETIMGEFLKPVPIFADIYNYI